MKVDVVLCKDCRWRHTDDCPMYFEEWQEWDDDGYLERDLVVTDNTVDDGFCDRGDRRDE